MKFHRRLSDTKFHAFMLRTLKKHFLISEQNAMSIKVYRILLMKLQENARDGPRQFHDCTKTTTNIKLQ